MKACYLGLVRLPVPLFASWLLLVPTLSAPLPAQEPSSKPAARMTLDDVRPGSFRPGRLPVARWTRDGRWLELEVDGKRIWVDPTTKEEKAERPDVQGPVAASRSARVLAFRNDLYLEPPGVTAPRSRPGARPEPSKDATRLTSDGKQKAVPQLAPDQKTVSFVREGDLVVLASGKEWQVTTGGSRRLLRGQLDWVYQEEIYGRGNYRGHWWSADSRFVAFLELDQSRVPDFTVIDHVPPGARQRQRGVVAEVTSYPKAGDPNPTVRIAVADCRDQKVEFVDLKDYAKDVLIVRAGFTPDNTKMWFVVQDRIQTWADLRVVDLNQARSAPENAEVTPTGAASTLWVREESKVWTPRPEAPRWLRDGSFLWHSSRTGFQHLYHYGKDGKLIRPVTSGEWEMRQIVRLDEKKGEIWFVGTQYGAIDRHCCRVKLDGSDYRCMTFEKGVHDLSFNHDGTFYLDTWSAMDKPPSVALFDAEGKLAQIIGQAPPVQSKFLVLPTRRLSIPARDGYEMDGAVLLPPGHRKDQPGGYPIFLPTYSGPGAPSVREGYFVNAYDQFMAQQGCIVLRVNVRSASHRGLHHVGACYKQLGVQELMDLEDSVDFAVEQFGGDPSRVAISGSSYGGFMAAYAMTNSEKFSVGLADAGVYDWRLYDSIYTERYMQMPEQNPDGYRKTSVIENAKNLRGHLLLTHGTMDDNVHLQNVLQLVYALQVARKQNFELMLYARSRHGVRGDLVPHLRELQWRTLRKHLRLEGDKPAK